MTHPLSCSCGQLKGVLSQSGTIHRGVCYCADCQAFARFLKRDQEILDPSGGTEIIQAGPGHVRFTRGVENLACMRLTGNGLLRWYAKCCNTPIANTPSNFKLPLVGLIHNCLSLEKDLLEKAFGPIRVHVYTKYALGDPKPKPKGLASALPRLVGMLVRPRVDGSYKQSPFFVPGSGTPVAVPKVLSEQELRNVKLTLGSL